MFYGQFEAVFHGGSLVRFIGPVIASLLQNSALSVVANFLGDGDGDGSRGQTAARPRVLQWYWRTDIFFARIKSGDLEAFDINQVANDVYEHNFGHRSSQRNIQWLTAHQLDAYKADTWIMSPPCQPYPRQGCRPSKGCWQRSCIFIPPDA